MNVVAKPDRGGQSSPFGEGQDETGSELDQFIKGARRQIWIILAFCAVGVALGVAYIAQSVPRYTASAVLIIDSAKDKSSVSASIADLTYDSGAIDSQLEVLKSEGTASSVLNRLDLAHNAEFLRNRESGISRWLGMLHGSGSAALDASLPIVGQDNEEERRDRVLRRGYIDKLQGGLDVRRVGRSYVINIEYTATDADLAAKIANGFAQAYVSDQLDAKFNAMKQTGEWLEKRTAEFKKRWLTSDLALQDLKANQNLITADGKPLGDQQMAQLSTQLTNAQAETAQTLARSTQIEALIKSGDIDAGVSGSLASPVINDLRMRYLRTAELESQISKSLGSDQQQAVALRQSMAGYNAQILEELKRIAESYKSDYEVASRKEASLRKAMADLAQANLVMDHNLISLRLVEGEVASNRQVYEALVRRLQDIEERQTFPEAEARVITDAAPPAVPAYPKRSVIMALALVLGGLTGVMIAVIRENRDRTFRTALDVRQGLKLPFLGMLPALRVVNRPMSAAQSRDPQHINARNSALTHSIDHPFSNYNEVLQSMKAAADINTARKGARVIGILSVRPNEGKTTVSKNFASLLARFGYKVILIDGDLHQRGLTSSIADTATSGLLEVVSGQSSIQDCVLTEPETGLEILPAVFKSRLPESRHILTSAAMGELIEKLRSVYEYVVIDLPPVGPIVGVRAVGSMIDGFVVVVEWGRTAQALVRDTILYDNEIMSKCLGVIYNKVNMRKVKMYEGVGSPTHQKDFDYYFKP